MFARYALILLVSLVLAACDRPPPLVQQESYVFGTRVEILVAGMPQAEAQAATAAVLADFDHLHRTYHAWRPSELTQLNAALARGEAVTVSQEMAGFIQEARELAALGAYRFDPGIGGLIERWGFHSEEFAARLPAAEELAAWRRQPASVAQLSVQGEQVRSSNPAVALDFGGYLKGVALDRAARKLREMGVRNALINIGGNVMALGDKQGRPWKVGIQHPRQPGPLATLELRDGEAIGTSGDYQRYFELDGQRYSHLLDPASGEPVRHTQAVTVLMPPGPRAGTLSDALSKPVFIAGPQQWWDVARATGAVQVLRVHADGGVQVSRSLAERLTWTSQPTRLEQLP